jgi:hypothetical protein
MSKLDESKPTKEFLVVDLINNLDYLAEDQPKILEKALEKAMSLDKHSLGHAIEKYGTPRTRKLLAKKLLLCQKN